MPLWCNEKLPGQSTSIHCFEFFAVLPVSFFEVKYIIFGVFSNTFGFFLFLKKGQIKFGFFSQLDFYADSADLKMILSDF